MSYVKLYIVYKPNSKHLNVRTAACLQKIPMYLFQSLLDSCIKLYRNHITLMVCFIQSDVEYCFLLRLVSVHTLQERLGLHKQHQGLNRIRCKPEILVTRLKATYAVPDWKILNPTSKVQELTVNP